MDRSVAQAIAISRAIREDVAEGLSPWVDLTPHHPLDRIVAGVRIGREEWLHRRELPWRIYSGGLSHCHPLIIIDYVPPESIRAAAQDIGRRASDVHVLAVGTCAIN
jgi:hypothetical protein